jgi:SAM-dependent MidA family methyltransferase
LPFSQFQELALYHSPAGFYGNRGNAGRSGDFITSPEVGGLFAQVMANALDEWWRRLRRPNPYFVIEAGAGTGTLASGIFDVEPECSSVLRYLTVERSAALRTEQTGRFPIESAERVLGVDEGTGSVVNRLKSPVVATLADLPDGPMTGVIIANELLDNLPIDIYERHNRHWYAVCVGISREGGFAETLVGVDDENVLTQLKHFAPSAPDGARVPLQHAAAAWLQRALNTIDHGRIVLIDYCRTTRWMAGKDWYEWLRTYRGHRPGTAPLEAPGTQDITCEVAVDQLRAVRPPDRDNTQTEFLEHYGLVDLVAEAREAWHSRAAMGDLGAARARSRVNEARALTDTHGLGRYRVLEWDMPMRTKAGDDDNNGEDDGDE